MFKKALKWKWFRQPPLHEQVQEQINQALANIVTETDRNKYNELKELYNHIQYELGKIPSMQYNNLESYQRLTGRQIPAPPEPLYDSCNLDPMVYNLREEIEKCKRQLLS
jgi:hypothetical protein